MNAADAPLPTGLESPLLSGISGLRHGFFGRKGGVSHGKYASLNCGPGSGDDAESVKQNRMRVVRALMGENATANLYTLHQVHGKVVVTLNHGKIPFMTTLPQADAIVTKAPNAVIGILTADCAPLLCVDEQAGVIAAIHAGWKGAVANVMKETIIAMEALGADRGRIRVAIGPCIQQKGYEVGEDMRANVMGINPAFGVFFERGLERGKFFFNLPGLIEFQLKAIKVQKIHSLGVDTLSNPELYFSYRRSTLSGDADYGRQLSVIAWAQNS